MELILEFDCDADIIDVPQIVIDNRELLRKRFLKWLFNKHNNHGYWVKIRNNTEGYCLGVRYRSDAFVEFLNKKVLKDNEQKAVILKQHVSLNEQHIEFPSIVF